MITIPGWRSSSQSMEMNAYIRSFVVADEKKEQHLWLTWLGQTRSKCHSLAMREIRTVDHEEMFDGVWHPRKGESFILARQTRKPVRVKHWRGNIPSTITDCCEHRIKETLPILSPVVVDRDDCSLLFYIRVHSFDIRRLTTKLISSVTNKSIHCDLSHFICQLASQCHRTDWQRMSSFRSLLIDQRSPSVSESHLVSLLARLSRLILLILTRERHGTCLTIKISGEQGRQTLMRIRTKSRSLSLSVDPDRTIRKIERERRQLWWECSRHPILSITFWCLLFWFVDHLLSDRDHLLWTMFFHEHPTETERERKRRLRICRTSRHWQVIQFFESVSLFIVLFIDGELTQEKFDDLFRLLEMNCFVEWKRKCSVRLLAFDLVFFNWIIRSDQIEAIVLNHH